MAWWQSVYAAACKVVLRGSNSLPRLHFRCTPSFSGDPEKLQYERIIAGVMSDYVSPHVSPEKLIEEENIRKEEYLKITSKFVEENKDYYSKNNDVIIIARKGE